MANKTVMLKVLVVTSSETSFESVKTMLPAARFDPIIHAQTARDARLRFSMQTPDIVMIVSPLKDETGIQLAVDLASMNSAEVLLLARPELFSRTNNFADKYGIITLAAPCSRQLILQTMNILGTEKIKIKRLEQQNQKLLLKIDEIRLIERAKLLLIEKLGMTENEAHKYIEKTAMDRCARKPVIAESIIKTYES